mmetsp:Transcript_11642/g.14726  ORF Transcript_11642/g.14726 Transcript_11642/m.14726 type:complete len:102 (+) Transcript_11642:386-691(+)
MDMTEELQTQIVQTRNLMDRRIKHIQDTLKLHNGDLQLIQEIVNLGRVGGKIMDHISIHVQGVVDKGPIAEIREQYAPRAYVEKEVMKVQNSQRRLADEQK